jgi:hypothetical protein
MPISWKGTLWQYAGRLHREHATKTDVRIIDFVDTGHLPCSGCGTSASAATERWATGSRNLRLDFIRKGKRGGLRVIYHYLTAEEKKELKKAIQAELEAKRRGS